MYGLTQLQTDINAGMPSNKMADLYGDLPQTVQQQLYSDIQAGMPVDEDTIKQNYPELIQGYVSPVQKFLNGVH